MRMHMMRMLHMLRMLHMHAYVYVYAASAGVCMRMQVVDGAPLEVRATLDVKQTVSFATVADELKELCKAPCVFRYQSQRRVACDRHYIPLIAPE